MNVDLIIQDIKKMVLSHNADEIADLYTEITDALQVIYKDKIQETWNKGE